MNTTQIRELSAAEITARIAELEEERFRLRVIRRDIARLKTVLREQEPAVAGAASQAGR